MILLLQARQPPCGDGITVHKTTLSASSALQIDRRKFLRLVAATAAALPMGCDVVRGKSSPMKTAVKITCLIRYEIDPYEGTNNVAWGLIAFDSLVSYEAYKKKLKADPDARNNFAAAEAKRFILREERNFVEIVDGTFGVSPAPGAAA